MKKVLGIIAVACTALTLAACGSSNSSSSKDSSAKSAKVEKKASSSSETAGTQPTKLNQQIADELVKKFNDDGDKNVKAEVQTDVVDDQSATNKDGQAQGHQVIKVTIIGAEALKTMKDAKEALDSNTADDTQTQSIAGVQTIVEEEAKKLGNDNDTISMGWPLEDADHTQLIALATRKENVIAIAGQN